METWASLVAQTVKNLPAMRETQARSLGWEGPLEKEMATHSSTLAWRIPWTEEPERLQSMGSQRVRYDWATDTNAMETHCSAGMQSSCSRERPGSPGHSVLGPGFIPGWGISRLAWPKNKEVNQAALFPWHVFPSIFHWSGESGQMCIHLKTTGYTPP